MTDTITLPRSVVEQALATLRMYEPSVVKFGLTFKHGQDAIAAISAALEQHQHESNSDKHLQEKTDHLSTTRSSVPPGWKLVGWWHQVEDPDECDFFYADAINGDCPSCHPCYADIGGEE